MVNLKIIRENSVRLAGKFDIFRLEYLLTLYEELAI